MTEKEFKQFLKRTKKEFDARMRRVNRASKEFDEIAKDILTHL